MYSRDTIKDSISRIYFIRLSRVTSTESMAADSRGNLGNAGPYLSEEGTQVNAPAAPDPDVESSG